MVGKCLADQDTPLAAGQVPVGSSGRTTVPRTGVEAVRRAAVRRSHREASYLRFMGLPKGAAHPVPRGGSRWGALGAVTQGEQITPGGVRKEPVWAERSPRSRGNNRGLRDCGRLPKGRCFRT
jgi:hypothetical protein